MATKVTISKRLEAEIRGACPEDASSRRVLEELEKLLDTAHSSKATAALGLRLGVRVFVDSVESGGRTVTKPPPGPIADRTYARLSKCLREMAVTEEQASMLGVWLVGEGQKAAPGDITIDRIIKNLGDWVTRAVANKPEYNKPEW